MSKMENTFKWSNKNKDINLENYYNKSEIDNFLNLKLNKNIGWNKYILEKSSDGFEIVDDVAKTNNLSDINVSGYFLSLSYRNNYPDLPQLLGGNGGGLLLNIYYSHERCLQQWFPREHPNYYFQRCKTAPNKWSDWFTFISQVKNSDDIGYNSSANTLYITELWKTKINNKQDRLIAGDNIIIDNNRISTSYKIIKGEKTCNNSTNTVLASIPMSATLVNVLVYRKRRDGIWFYKHGDDLSQVMIDDKTVKVWGVDGNDFTTSYKYVITYIE